MRIKRMISVLHSIRRWRSKESRCAWSGARPAASIARHGALTAQSATTVWRYTHTRTHTVSWACCIVTLVYFTLLYEWKVFVMLCDLSRLIFFLFLFAFLKLRCYYCCYISHWMSVEHLQHIHGFVIIYIWKWIYPNLNSTNSWNCYLHEFALHILVCVMCLLVLTASLNLTVSFYKLQCGLDCST